MTANIKIPVASADNVTAAPLAAVFTEKNPDSDLMERFVFVQQGETFEKRPVKVGVSDYFYAEIQEGLSAGEVVSLELPKEEREKKARQLAGQRPGGVENAGLGARAGAPPATGSTNLAPSVTGASAADASAKARPTGGRSGGRDGGGGSR